MKVSWHIVNRIESPLSCASMNTQLGAFGLKSSRAVWTNRAGRSGRLDVTPALAKEPAAALRNLDQFHLPVPPAMEHIQISTLVAKNEKIAITEFGILDSFFNGHRFHSDRVGT